jgi:hypothetical protein
VSKVHEDKKWDVEGMRADIRSTPKGSVPFIAVGVSSDPEGVVVATGSVLPERIVDGRISPEAYAVAKAAVADAARRSNVAAVKKVNAVFGFDAVEMVIAGLFQDRIELPNLWEHSKPISEEEFECLASKHNGKRRETINTFRLQGVEVVFAMADEGMLPHYASSVGKRSHYLMMMDLKLKKVLFCAFPESHLQSVAN